VTLRHAFAIAFGVSAFILVSFFVARWLTAENRERDAVTDLLRAQSGGDAPAMLAILDGCAGDAGCREVAERNARTLRRAGRVRILRIDSATSHAVLAQKGKTRVAWDVGGSSFPVVQCVQVERRGIPILGGPVVLREISPKIRGDAAC
jgi:hypothetical protein